MENELHLYEIGPRKDHSGVNLISDALPFGPLRYQRGNQRNTDGMEELRPRPSTDYLP
jgi:hypothetical protein